MISVLLVLCAAPDPELMKRLAEHAARTSERGEVKVTTRSEELDMDGHVLNVREDTARQGAKRAAAAKDDDDTAHLDVSFQSPFAADRQALYVFKVLAPRKGSEGLVRIAFTPVGKKAEDLLVGEALVDPVAGEPVRLVVRPWENPRFVDQLLISMELDEKSPEGRRPSRIEVSGSAGFLFFKRRFHAVTTFGG